MEPLGPWRTAVDGARLVQALADHPRDRQAKRLIQVCDHLNTHADASFDRSFPPAEARHRARRVQRVFTPRHGRWLHRAATVRRVLKNELTPWRRVQRCYPLVSPEADFVIPRERVLDRYHRPYDARYPVLCRDEQPKLLRPTRV